MRVSFGLLLRRHRARLRLAAGQIGAQRRRLGRFLPGGPRRRGKLGLGLLRGLRHPLFKPRRYRAVKPCCTAHRPAL